MSPVFSTVAPSRCAPPAGGEVRQVSLPKSFFRLHQQGNHHGDDAFRPTFQ